MSDESKSPEIQDETRPKIDKSSLRLPLQDINNTKTNSKYPKNVPLSAPPRHRNDDSQSNIDAKHRKTPPLSARTHRTNTNESDTKTMQFILKRTIPYTPRLDELPLTVRLHSNPMILLQSLRRQKVSNYNMYHIEPAIDNKPSKNLLKYAHRRKKIRECNDPFPNMPKLDIPNDIPLFVAKQFKYEVFQNRIRTHNQHKHRCANMVPHIDNKLPKHILSYRKMRKNRLKNAQKRARKLHEKRLQSPINTNKAPKAPTRKAPPNMRKRLSQIEREKLVKAGLKSLKKSKENKSERKEAVSVVYIPERTARESKFIPSPKAKKLDMNKKRRTTLVQALPCHFDEWD